MFSGKVLPVGADFILVGDSGKLSLDFVSIFQTSDGANILLKGQGYNSKDGYIYFTTSFETGSEKYDWVNYAVGVSSAKAPTSGAGAGITLEVFVVRLYNTNPVLY